MEDFTPTKSDAEGTESKGKKTIFLTPSASNICILCHKDITILFKNDTDGRRKRKLWDGPNKKTELCKLLESYLDIEVSQTQDFQCMCVYCADKVKSGMKSQTAKRENVFVGRELASAQFLRTRSYTRSSLEPPSKKQLLYEKDKSEPLIKVDIHEDETKVHFIPQKYMKLVKLLAQQNEKRVMCELQSLHEKTFISTSINLICDIVDKEARNLCSSKMESSFAVDDVGDVEKISYDHHYQELLSKSPTILSMISAIAIRPDIDSRNKQKTSESLKPSLINAIGSLLFCRNQKMNTNPLRNSLVLRRGQADKMCIKRLNKLSICMDHTSVLRKQSDLANQNFAPVLLLKNELDLDVKKFESKIKTPLYHQPQSEIPMLSEESAMQILTADADVSFFEEGALNPRVEIIDASSESGTNNSDDVSTMVHSLSHLPSWEPRVTDFEIQKSSPSDLEGDFSFKYKFVFVGDNVDVKTKRRNYQIGKSNIDRHLYNLMVVENRVPIPQDLVGKKSMKNIDLQQVPLTHFIPTENDETLYKDELKNLILRDLVKYVEEIKWMKPFVVEHIPHKFTKETTMVSNYFPLGLLDKNEATTEGIIDIMREQHQFVPGHDTPHPLRMISFGDLLTVERKENAQEDLRDHSSPSSRLEGLVPALADFHTYGNFFEVIWHLLYNPRSSNDTGTLFQARNFLNTRSVPSSPMKDINACEDLLFKYSDALLLAAFQQLRNDCSLDLSEPETDGECRQKIDDILTSLMEKYVLPEVNDDINFRKSYSCPHCRKSYKRTKNLSDHIKTAHQGKKVNNSNDGVVNYSINALSLCFLAKNFNDSRKHGDGDRISRLYKYLLLYFKLDSRHKYAFQSLHFLSQISFLLPPALSFELKWNRFVNTKGKIDSNVEIDRHIEHENKYIKRDLKQYQGKLTELSIERSSKSYGKVESLMKKINTDLGIDNPSGRHSTADATDDIKKLAAQFEQAQIFKHVDGRNHWSFPSAPKNFLDMLDMGKMRKWISNKIRDFQRRNIYQQDNMVVDL